MYVADIFGRRFYNANTIIENVNQSELHNNETFNLLGKFCCLSVMYTEFIYSYIVLSANDIIFHLHIQR